MEDFAQLVTAAEAAVVEYGQSVSSGLVGVITGPAAIGQHIIQTVMGRNVTSAAIMANLATTGFSNTQARAALRLQLTTALGADRRLAAEVAALLRMSPPPGPPLDDEDY